MYRSFETLPAVQPALAAVSIVPNRTSLNHRFPCLGFFVSTGGLPWFEVLIAVDRSLFDPANAGNRTAGRFYSSRSDAGLISAQTEASAPPSLYLVPTAVLHAIAKLDPLPHDIFYTAIAYAGPDGSGPVYAHVPERLSLEAPAVAVAADFSTGAVGRGLTLAVDRLRTVGASGFAVPLASAADGTIGGLPVHKPVVTPPLPKTAPPQVATPPEATSPAVERRHEPAPAAESPALNGTDSPRPPERALVPGNPAVGGAEPAPYDDGFDEPCPPLPEHGEASDWVDIDDEAPSAGPTEYGDDDKLAPPVPNGDPTVAPPVANGTPPVDTVKGLSFEALDAKPAAPESVAPPKAALPAPLSADLRRQLIEKVSGYGLSGPRYDALSLDGEFRGRFGQDHPYYGRAHAGLGYGIVRFGQDSGDLGRLLVRMRERDASMFDSVFGPAAAELVEITTRQGPPALEGADGRSVRVQPVAGVDLWEEPWLARFRTAATISAFQAAQNQTAAELYLDPLLPYALDLGLDTQRALVMACDRIVDMGFDRGLEFVVEAIGPVRSEDQRAAALAALGMETLADFQRSRAGVEVDGVWGPQTHSALAGAMRRIGAKSPIVIPTLPDMLDSLVRRGAAFAFAPRLAEMRSDPALSDEPLAGGAPA